MVGKSNTLKVFFPGLRYSSDRSYLYYLDKYIEGDSIYVEYSRPRNVDFIGDIHEEFEKDYALALEKLKDIDWSSYGEIIFIGKSLGTLVAGKIREELKIDRARFICLTPLTETLEYIKQTDFVITSKSDEYIDLSKLKGNKNLYPFLTIHDDLPHSLEYKNNYHRTFQVLEETIDLALNYLDTAYRDLLG